MTKEQLLENRGLWRVFECKMYKVAGNYKKLNNVELKNL
jgi:hypothetical protein